MTYRIKVKTLRNGEQDFYPQYRLFGVWFHFHEMNQGGGCSAVVWGSLENARKFISNHIKQQTERKGRKGMLTQYVKYP